MIPLFDESRNSRAFARTVTRRGEWPAVCRARLVCALALIVFGAEVATAAVPLSRYQGNIHQVVIELKALEQWAKVDSQTVHAARVTKTLNDVRETVPVEETLEWDGGTIHVNNSWLAEELQAYERMPPHDPRRAGVLARITQRLSAIEERLNELNPPGAATGARTEASADKAREKARLEKILSRAEFNPQPPEKSIWQRIWDKLTEWWNRLFGGVSIGSGQGSWLSFIAMIIIFGLAGAVLAYAIWRIVLLLQGRKRKGKTEKREARVILGERLAPDQKASDILAEAEALARKGELRAAIRKAYIALLCELGDRKVITLAQHKTNRDYLRAVRERRPLLNEMQKLTSSFENHWYGFRQATHDDWAAFLTGYQKTLKTVTSDEPRRGFNSSLVTAFMRQSLGIFITVTVVAVLLVALNTASYVSEREAPDTEFNPDRSTYNAGATGTRAFHDLLSESGRQVVRWGEKPEALLIQAGDDAPATFVVVGSLRVPFEKEETQNLLHWVERGGRLVIIDRTPDPRLLPPSGGWTVSAETNAIPGPGVHPDKSEEMTAGVERVRPATPSVLTRNVESVLPSRFAGAINVSPPADDESETQASSTAPTPADEDDLDDESGFEDELEPPPAQASYSNPALSSPAPVAHLSDKRGALLVDYPYGAGRIVVLSDPYIVSNGGIRLDDNLQLAVNAVAGGGGVIAFDEYHQGRAASRNRLAAYFAGTPVLWMVAQGGLIVLALLWTRGRRFARPLPVRTVDRRSSLEFVASMAELQQRARAYDLAVENIYTRVRRVLVRYAGLGHNSKRSEIAARVAARSQKISAARLESLMRECEDAINGAPIDARKSLELVRQLRALERALGLRMRSREARQAAEGLQQTTV